MSKQDNTEIPLCVYMCIIFLNSNKVWEENKLH